MPDLDRYEAEFQARLREAYRSPPHRCEGCGLINDHTDACAVHDLLDSIDAALDGLTAQPLPVQAIVAVELPTAIVREPGFLDRRYFDVRPRWIQRLARWCRNRLRDWGLYKDRP